MSKGPRLVQRGGRWNWYIRITEGGKTCHIPTRTSDVEEANEFLNNYEAGLEAPASRTIGELLNARVKARSPYVERPEALVEHATALKKYWEQKYPEQVEDHLTFCGNNRRQLEELRAALKLAEKRKWIEKAPHVELPPKSQPKDKFWLTSRGRCFHTPHIGHILNYLYWSAWLQAQGEMQYLILPGPG